MLCEDHERNPSDEGPRVILRDIMGCATSSPTTDVTGDNVQKVNGAKHASAVGGGSRDRREANGGEATRRGSRNKGGIIHRLDGFY